MYSRVNTGVVQGIEGKCVEIETHITRGLPCHVIVGLPSTVIREAKERVKSAIKGTSIAFPADHIAQNLYPAHIKKEGSHLDLPLAMGIIMALQDVSAPELAFLGELSLEGRIQPVKGILSLLEGLKEAGITQVVIPEQNLESARYIQGICLYPYTHLSDLVRDFWESGLKPCEAVSDVRNALVSYPVDYSEVKGHAAALRALEIAVTGFHNILIIGPPGCGKTMLAERLTTIMPPMSVQEQIELTKIYSVSETDACQGDALISHRPFRAPHHSITRAGLIGGRLPGEISRAHAGVLYLDEMGEFKPDVLEALREPMSSGHVNLNKHHIAFHYPAQFMLVGTMNPCPCGDHLSSEGACRCTMREIHRYYNKLSGPILDRIHMTLIVDRVSVEQARSGGEPSASIRRRIYENRSRPYAVQMEDTARRLLAQVCEREKLSMRSAENLTRVAGTIAGMAGRTHIEKSHLMEALSYQTSIQIKRLLV